MVAVGRDEPDGRTLLKVQLGQAPGEQGPSRPPSGKTLGASDSREVPEAVDVEEDDLRIVLATRKWSSTSELPRIRQPVGELHEVGAEAVLRVQGDASMSLAGAFLGVAERSAEGVLVPRRLVSTS